jgi:hypothetical protein
MQTLVDTTNWAKFPVTVQGVNLVSEVDPAGSFYPQLVNMPSEMFQAMHIQMISELIGDISNLTREELEAELVILNEGASQAVISLA